MRHKSLLLAATLAMVATSPGLMAATSVWQDPKPRRRDRPTVQRWAQIYGDPAIEAWNKAVDARKAARKAAKDTRESPIRKARDTR